MSLNGCALNAEQLRLITESRHILHSVPELACEETETKAYILRFLHEHTSLEVHDMGRWIYAAHREQAGETEAFRADFDAVPTEDGSPAHRCGHDGHTAALLALALMIEGKCLGRNVILLFQHAEEVGLGAPECCELFELEHIDRMYGCHNIPGEPLGIALLRKGTFACASCGMEIDLFGKPTHAAYPENGFNPTSALAKLALSLPGFARVIQDESGAMTISTIVGMYSGERAFGVAAAKGAVYATLRSEMSDCLERLIGLAEAETEKLAVENGLEKRIEFYDKFPATVNAEAMMTEAENRFEKAGIKCKYLEVPFRWSEDFGHYGNHTQAFFFGIGSGVDTCPLHTEGYEYPDELAFMTAKAFFALI